ncbi:DUF4082 domain-containing protein [Planctomycetota bacterium]
MRLWLKVALAGAVMAFLPLKSADAGTVAFGFTGGTGGNAGNALLGYEFTVDTDIEVTHVGLFDYGTDGLSGASQIGIWTMGGTLLADATVPSGTTAPLTAGWRYEPLASPLLLSAGESYVIGGYQANESYYQDATIVNLTSDVTFGNARRQAGGGFVIPATVDPTDNAGYFGPNFQFDLAEPKVPEPSIWLLLGAALVGLAVALRRSHSMT